MTTGPNMATITASLERSLQNCSLNNHRQGGTTSNSGGIAPADGFTDSSENHAAFNVNNPSDDATLELNSEISLPYHWEQCLDLKVQNRFFVFIYHNHLYIFCLFLDIYCSSNLKKAQILDFIHNY
ncbi:hypothetical protein HAX54_039349 [Datura stramonium]|uniref:WW domain-containing protein n=1 Tax=Datura stramonium TaxID=4076 RepID=A0ABS8Y803_DATST|nr:hypothetical protein [Datura stramonium]